MFFPIAVQRTEALKVLEGARAVSRQIIGTACNYK